MKSIDSDEVSGWPAAAVGFATPIAAQLLGAAESVAVAGLRVVVQSNFKVRRELHMRIKDTNEE